MERVRIQRGKEGKTPSMSASNQKNDFLLMLNNAQIRQEIKRTKGDRCTRGATDRFVMRGGEKGESVKKPYE